MSTNLADCSLLVVLHATFSDSTLAFAALDQLRAQPFLWAFPEPRSGGRLRLNSLCGLNLLAFQLVRKGFAPEGIYAPPSSSRAISEVRSLHEKRATRDKFASAPLSKPSAEQRVAATNIADSLHGAAIGIIGEPPAGFEACGNDASTAKVLGVRLEDVPIGDLFDAARVQPSPKETVVRLRSAASGLDVLDTDAVRRSARLHDGLRTLVEHRGWAGAALRCWPECFDAYGAAPCAAMALLANAGTPICCEADAAGAVTSLLLQNVAGAPAFIADLVDIDHESNTVAFWHCGVAPPSLAASHPTAANHPNRAMPLTLEFGLKPGRVTIARLSQSRNRLRLVVTGGEVLEEPAAFNGTTGTVRLDASTQSIFDAMVHEGLEHHYGLVYGDHQPVLHALAEHWGIPVVQVGQSAPETTDQRPWRERSTATDNGRL